MVGNQSLMLAMFAAFGALLALATGKLPILTVSVTSPLFGWITLEAFAANVRPSSRWLILAAAFWFSLLCSLVVNVTWGELGAVGLQELAMLGRYTFWLAVFLVTASVAAEASWIPRLSGWLAATAGALAMLRLADAAFAHEPWLDQNEYGLRFSAFTPFLLCACLGRAGFVWTAGLVLTLAALLGNGSRSCWVALAVAGLALLLMHAFAGRGIGGLVIAFAVVPVLLGAALCLGPDSWSRRVSQRWETFGELEADKPFQTRLALLEKGARLFEEKPLFGAGLGRFNLERVELASNRTPWANNRTFNSRSSHNAYVSLLAETGLAGALAFGVLLVTLLAGGARAAYRLTLRGEEWAAGVWASALAVSVHLWTLAGLTGTLPWFVFGLTAGMIERERRRRYA